MLAVAYRSAPCDCHLDGCWVSSLKEILKFFFRLKARDKIIHLLPKTRACEWEMCFSMLLFLENCYFLCQGGSLNRTVGASPWSHIVLAISRTATMWKTKSYRRLSLTTSCGVSRAEQPTRAPAAWCHQARSRLRKALRLLAKDSQAVRIANVKSGIWSLGWAG